MYPLEYPETAIGEGTVPCPPVQKLAHEEGSAVQRFKKRHKRMIPILLDKELAVYKDWPVLGVPTSFLIDGVGLVAYTAVGALEWMDSDNLAKVRSLITELENGQARQVSR